MNKADTAYNQIINQSYSDIMDEANRAIDQQIEGYGLERLESNMWMNLLAGEFGRVALSYNNSDSPEVTLESIGNMVACGIRLYAEIIREVTGDTEREENLYDS